MKSYKIFLLAALLFNAGNVKAEARFDSYQDFKNYLDKKYGFDYNFDVSVLAQRSSPNGEHNAVQAYLYPSFMWTTFNNEYGVGALNFAYTIIRYGNHDASDLGTNSGFVTPINDYPANQNEFSELYYTYQPSGKWNWLTLGVGQFPIYNFDGTDYDANQQVNFLNDSLAQNASASYTQAGIGAYAQITPNDRWSFAFGGQDATNVDAVSVRFNHLDEKHYTTFGYAAYTPTIKGVGDAEISILVYNQPGVTAQPQTTNGWSLNLSQDIGKKLSLFARVNEVSGSVEEIRQSWVLGGVYNNPLNRNSLDQIGLAYAYNKLDEAAVGEKLNHKAEQIIEAYWAWGIGDMLTITPDVQMYINPGLNQKSDYGFATSLRATVFF
ncbi:MAG: carbohydrate porin [Alphaproteobacteria bacterium]|nr:carbohydrate porin [Alphaproteobacteria bacterium]